MTSLKTFRMTLVSASFRQFGSCFGPFDIAKGSRFYLFLKLVQINLIFSDNVRILYMYIFVLADNLSQRDPKKGAVYIQNLLAVVKKYYKESHLEEMLVIVRHRFLKDQIKQMPCTWSTLTKLFYLKNMWLHNNS